MGGRSALGETVAHALPVRTKFRRKNRYRQYVNTIFQTLTAAYIKLGISLINTTLLHWQIENPKLIQVKTLQLCEAIAMCIECVLVPLYWLIETNRNFPELTSSRNKIVNNVGYRSPFQRNLGISSK